MDGDGNHSTTNTVRFTYVVYDRLTLSMTGEGGFSPNYSNAVLMLGKVYTLTAQPRSGYVFSNWTGSFLCETSTLKFTMQSNLAFQANFIPSPFLAAKGKYAGLFFDPANPSTNAGYFTASLLSTGTFSSSLAMPCGTYSFSGKLSLTGGYSNSVARTGLTPLQVQLQADLASGEMIDGSIGDGSWTVPLLAYRGVYSTNSPAPQGGKKYTLAFSGSEDPAQPAGFGSGAASVDASGNVSFTGTLGDGTAITASTLVSRGGLWPLYSSLYSRKGIVLGWLGFTNAPDSDLAGWLFWVKTARASTNYYPLGYTNVLEAIGSRYAFTNGIPLLSATNGVVVFDGGNLAGSLTNGYVLGANNRFTTTNKMSLTVLTNSGLFKGGFINPANSKSNVLNGALLQKQNAGYGGFLGTNRSGSVFLGP